MREKWPLPEHRPEAAGLKYRSSTSAHTQSSHCRNCPQTERCYKHKSSKENAVICKNGRKGGIFNTLKGRKAGQWPVSFSIVENAVEKCGHPSCPSIKVMSLKNVSIREHRPRVPEYWTRTPFLSDGASSLA